MFKRGVVCTLLVVSVVMANPSDTWASHQDQGQNTRPWGSVLLQALGGIGADRETLQYLLPRLAAKYRPSEAWGGVQDPRFYILSEYGNLQNPKLLQNIQDDNQDSTDLFSSDKRNAPGRTGPSLSIVQPLDVLRQRMLLEIARRRAMEQVKQAAANREILTKVGKRSIRQQNTQQ